MIVQVKHFSERHLTSIEGLLVKALVKRGSPFIVSDMELNRGFWSWLKRSVGKNSDVTISDLGFVGKNEGASCWIAQVTPKDSENLGVFSSGDEPTIDIPCIKCGFDEKVLVHDLNILIPSSEEEVVMLCRTGEPFLVSCRSNETQEALKRTISKHGFVRRISPIYERDGKTIHLVQVSPTKKGIIPETLL